MAHDDKAYQRKTLGDLQDKFIVTYHEDKSSWIASGVCPECQADVERTYRITSLTAAASGGIAIDNEPPSEDGLRTMACDCGYNHDGRPDDGVGCGAYWKVKL